MCYKIILGFYLNRVKNDQSGIGMIREDLSEVEWSDHVGGEVARPIKAAPRA